MTIASKISRALFTGLALVLSMISPAGVAAQHRATRARTVTAPAPTLSGADWDCAGTMPAACATLLTVDDLDDVPEPQRAALIRDAAVAGNRALGTRDAPNACAARCLVAVAVQQLNSNGSAEAERVGRAVAHVIPGELRNTCVLGLSVLRNTAARAAAASTGEAVDCAPMEAPATARALALDCIAVPDRDVATLRTMAARSLADTALHCRDTGYLGASYLALAPHDDPAATLLRTYPTLPGGLTGARQLAVAEQIARSLAADNRDVPAVRNMARRLRAFLRAAPVAGIPAHAAPLVTAAHALIRLDGASAQVSPLNLGDALEDLLFLHSQGLLDDVRVAQTLPTIPFASLAGARIGGVERQRYMALAGILHAARDPHATLAAFPLAAALAMDGELPDDCTAARNVLQAIQHFRGSEVARVFEPAIYAPLQRQIAERGHGLAQRCPTAEPERAVFLELLRNGAAPQQRNDFVGDEAVVAARPRPRRRRP